MHRRTRSGLVAAAAVLAASITASPASAAKPVVTMSGSTSVAPLAEALARGYLKAFPNTVTFKLLQGGSDVGVADVARGRVSIGNSSRDPQASDPGGLVFNRIARDGVCIVTNPNNKLANISQDQVQQIFAGRVRNWSDVPGATAKGPIDLVTRSQASGTQDAFQNIFMGGPNGLRVAASASQRASNGLVQSAVRSNENAIGYVDFKFTDGTNPVAYKGVACNLRNAKAGTYPGLRSFWMVTRGKPAGATGKFISWIRSNPKAKAIIGTNWVPAK